MGSVGLAAWIALLLFPALLIIGALRGDLERTAITVFVALGILVWIVLPRVTSAGASYVTPALAILDIALVFVVFKGDVHL